MKRYASLLMVLGISLLLGACTQQREIDALNRRISQQEQQLQTVNRQVSDVQPAQADTWAQVQSLRQEMASVRGEIDDFNNATAALGGLQGLATRVDSHHAALQVVETQFGMNLKLQDTKSGAVQPVPDTSTAKPLGEATSALSPALVPAPPSVDTATTLYDTGITSFNARKYQHAFNAFRDFTETYTDNKLIANAWFWRGESNYQMAKYAAAALDYETVIAKYPDSSKLPAAYLKQGMSFFKTGKNDAARFRLDELLKKFPQSPEAVRAKNVLKENEKNI